MRTPQQIVKRPLLTEKGTRDRETGGRSDAELEATPEVRPIIHFEVALGSDKIEIRMTAAMRFAPARYCICPF